MSVKDNAIFFEPSECFEEGATFALCGDGLLVSVAQEKAVDSDNQSFECCLHMTAEQVCKLRDWINKKFSS